MANPSTCIFCKIAAKEIPSELLLENETLVAFRDINPVADTHILIVPKIHYQDIRELAEDPQICANVLNQVAQAAKQIADQFHLTGFRLVNNCGESGGQTIPHLHFHLLASKDALRPDQY